MRRWISFPRTEGVASRQAHADLPPGTYEHEIGREGFSGPATHIYHVHPPTDWSDWEGPLRPRAFDLMKLDALASSPWSATTVMENTHLRFRLWRLESSMDHLVRNGDGDDLLVVHEGEGDLFCDFGHLAFRDGDYIVLPRGVNWRMETAEGATLLLIEATNDSYRLPERGLVGEHAIFDPAILDTPVLDSAFRIQQSEDEVWRVVIKRRGALSSVTYPFNPLDAVGWKGNALPVRLNWREIRPLMSHRYHLPPSAHTTFVAERFLISTFVPRPIESDPGALKVPFFHSNDDYDEVIFYHRGAFSSRDNIAPGMLTLHPAGALHGPHPKAFASGARRGRGETDEVAVMIDARDPLDVSEAASAVEWAGYVDSWRRQGPRRGEKGGQEAVKLGSLRAGGRDGRLIVVSTDLKRGVAVADIAPTLQAALDDWPRAAAELARAAERLAAGQCPDAFDLDPAALAAPLPRAYQWADGSAYLNHVELVRKARGAELPPELRTDPLMYQGGSDGMLGPRQDIAVATEDWGIDFEAEVAVLTDDVAMGVSAEAAAAHIVLVMLVNDVSLRNLVAGELAKGFGFFQSKPASAFSPVAVTPDELGEAWDGGKLHLPLLSALNGEPYGQPDAGADMTFDFPTLIAHAAKTRSLGAGTIVGSGTVSNRDRSRGASCLAERRMIETLEEGAPRTPFLRFGDLVRIEMLDADGASIFGAIEQRVVPWKPA